MTSPIPMRHEAMRIAGRKVDTKDRVPVEYPFTGEVIGSVPAGTAEHVREAFEIAANYQPTLTRYERQKILLNVAKIINDRKAELAPIITAELGISLADSLYECGRAYDVYTLAGQMCIHDDGEIFSCDLTPHGKARKIFTTREPLRAISAITPFNHPLNMVSHKIAPAIATNNCVVLKPTELTPLTAIWLADALYEAGLPPQMLSVITGWPGDVGDEMITNPNFDLITFTGGVPVGKMIAAKAVYKRQVLELGGNDPLIICTTCLTPIWRRRRIWRWRGLPRIRGSVAPQSNGYWCRKAWLIGSCRWCWSGQRSCGSATRWIRPPNWAPWCRPARRSCSKSGFTWQRLRGLRCCTIPAARGRCCRRLWWIMCRMKASW